ncbi:MAG: hypothetical protein IPL10_20560 [Bacteroidetes bacterium]|nr:hypothetical protein [Bacteroidota bacterium]
MVAKIKDSHTWADHSKLRTSIQNRLLFPFAIYNSGSNYVLSKSGIPEYDSFIGSTITKINGKNINDIISKTIVFMSIEGKNTSALNSTLQYFPFYYYLIDTTSSFRVQLVDNKGIMKEINLYGTTFNTFTKLTRKVVNPIQKEFTSKNIAVLTVNTFIMVTLSIKK